MQQTYFISDGTRLKVGKSRNPVERLAQLQTASSKKLTLLVTLDGDYELAFHGIFRDARTQGEWFEIDWRLKEFLTLTTNDERLNFLRDIDLDGDLRIVNQSGIENTILCPFCNGSLNIYQHIGKPEVTSNAINDRIVRIPIEGECGHRWFFTFHTHAGQTCISAVRAT